MKRSFKIVVMALAAVLVFGVQFAFAADSQPEIKMFPESGSTGLSVAQEFTVIFSEPVKVTESFIDAVSLENTANPEYRGANLQWLSDKIMVVSPASDMSPNSKYSLGIKEGAVVNAKGKVNKAFNALFTTGADKVAPKVMGASFDTDNNGKEFLYIGESAFVSFSEPVMKVDGVDIKIKDATGKQISAEVTLGESSVEVLPDKTQLVLGQAYVINVPKGAVKDKSGNPSIEEFNFEFLAKKDDVKPGANLSFAPDGTVYISAYDNASGVKQIRYSVDGTKSYVFQTDNVDIAPQNDGKLHQLQITIEDGSNNCREISLGAQP